MTTTRSVFIVCPVFVLCLASVASSQFGGLKDLDPTNKNSGLAKITGHTLDPSVVFPRPRGETLSTFDDPETVPVIYRIDPNNGDVYEGTANQKPQRTGIKASVHVENGVRYWVYMNAPRQPIPNGVDNQGLRHHFDGVNLFIKNNTDRRFAFKVSFVPGNAPQESRTFDDRYTLDPGQQAEWKTGETGVSVVYKQGTLYYLVNIEGIDPANGQVVEKWGPTDSRPGLAAADRGMQTSAPQNGVIHQRKNVQFNLKQ